VGKAESKDGNPDGTSISLVLFGSTLGEGVHLGAHHIFHFSHTRNKKGCGGILLKH